MASAFWVLEANGCTICDKLIHVLSEFIKRGRSILNKLFTIVKKYDEMYLFTLHECSCNNSNNLLTGCLIKKLQALIKKALSIYVIETEGAEYSFISKVFFLLCI